jgi:hypothetical protein
VARIAAQPLCNLAERAALPACVSRELAEREPRFGAPPPADVASVGWQSGAAFVFARERLGESFRWRQWRRV